MIQETSNYLTFTYELLVEDLKVWIYLDSFMQRSENI